MKQQVSRLSPHQNGKVFGVLSALVSLIVVVPVFLLASVSGAASQGVPLWAIFIAPVVYLVLTYIMVVIGCALYNVVVPMTGGIEYDASPGAA